MIWTMIPSVMLALASIVLAVISLRMSRVAVRRAERAIELLTNFMPGCCGSCSGLGVDESAPETGGKCWDCQGTGHLHVGPCTPTRW